MEGCSIVDGFVVAIAKGDVILEEEMMIGGLLSSFLIYLCTSNRIIMENRRCGSILFL